VLNAVLLLFVAFIIPSVLQIPGDKKFCVHLMSTVQKRRRNILVSVTYHDNVVRIRDNVDVSVSVVSPGPWRSAAKQIESSSEATKTCVVIKVLSVEERTCTETF
jgi:hypothetical protein